MISKNNFILLGRKDQVKKINGLSVNLKGSKMKLIDIQI